ncbi:MAG: type II toxin-antitoxin system RelE/ParE family toxin [Pyrinomonadaceae bacterium]
MNEEDLDKLPSAKLSPFAADDLREIWLYISENSREFADRTIEMILQKCKFISSNPKIGRTRHDLIIDLRLFPYKNYNIFYFIIDDGVEIYRVLHSSRDVIQIFDDVIDDTI